MLLVKELKTSCWVSNSSGIDSTAITHILYKKRFLQNIYHFNHKLRPQNDEMENKVRNFYEEIIKPSQYDIELHVLHSQDKLVSESQCRFARLNIFNNNSSINLVTGAHLDDAVEAYLLNIFRGHEGFLPIPLISSFQNNNQILHPFLLYPKQFFIDYCEKHDLMKYVVEDETNKQTKGSRRNLIRNEILPILEREKVGLRTIVKKKILQRIYEKSNNN